MVRVNSAFLSDHLKGLVGIDKSIKDLKSLLFTDSSHARVVGIWGMGGLGKTTLARVVYEQCRYEFEGHYFLENVREQWEKHGSTGLLQKFSEKERLGSEKLLIVLDDVNDVDQYHYLVKDLDELNPKSRIILTSRDRQVFLNVGVDEIYNLRPLYGEEAFQLFCLHAFKRNCAPEGFVKMSREFVYYAGGVPLALRVLGSHLYNSKSKKEWKSTLNKLRVIPNVKIHNILKISYDGLDDKQKEIFLDIACFFKIGNGYKDTLEELLDDGGCFAVLIRDLDNKSLITISKDKIHMHDLLQEMGREIIRNKQPEEQSRLCIANDICDVLRNNSGTAGIEGILLADAIREDVVLEPDVFIKMRNLRLLQISVSKGQFQFHLPWGLHSFPNSIRYLKWDTYPLGSLGSHFTLRNLVTLDMPYSQLERFWNGSKHDLQYLKFVDLCESKRLTCLPDLSSANLSRLNLKGCTSIVELPPLRFETEEIEEETEEESIDHCCFPSCDLYRELDCDNRLIEDWWDDVHYDINFTRNKLSLQGCHNLKILSEMSGNIKYMCLRSAAIEELHSSIWSLHNLIFLDLKDCKLLKNLPSSICDLGSLECLDMGGCLSVDKFPVFPKNIRRLNLSGTSIKQVDESSFECVPYLETLIMNNCTRLKTLPTSICKLKCLQILSLSGCLKFNSFPEILEPMETLQGLFLNETRIKELHSSIENLSCVKVLNLSQCKNLESIPNNIYNIVNLDYLYLGECPRLKRLPPISFNYSSQYISVDISFSNLLKLPDSFKASSSLEMLDPSGIAANRIPICIILERFWNMSFVICKCLRSNSRRGKLLFEEHDDGIHINVGLTRFTHYFCKFLKQFVYCEYCLNFDDVYNILMTEFQLNVLHRATASVLKHGIQEADHPRISFSYPGNKIPEWFTDRSTGSSIDINFSPLRHDTSFLGFALYIFADCDDYWNCETKYLDFSCEYHFKTKDGEGHQYRWTSQRCNCVCDYNNYMQKINSTSHVFIWHLYEDDYHDYYDATGASFKFYLDGTSEYTFCRHIVKECGIRRLTLQDAEEFGVIKGLEQNINFDTNEPHPKRIKISN